MEQLDKDIEDAKEAGNRALKKELKRKYVGFMLSSVLWTDRSIDKSFSSWTLETVTLKKAYKKSMPRKFLEED